MKYLITFRALGLLVLCCAPATGLLASEEASEPDEPPMNMNRPGSIVERLGRDAERTDYLFQFPGVAGAMQSWDDWKSELEANHGFKFGVSYTSFYQKTNESFGPEDDAASFDLDIAGTWTFLGRGTDAPTMLGFDFFKRDTLGTDIPPQVLFTQN